MEDRMNWNCTQKNCPGEVKIKKEAIIKIDYHSHNTISAFACEECSRLYFLDGYEVQKILNGVANPEGAEAFLIKGEVIYKKPSK